MICIHMNNFLNDNVKKVLTLGCVYKYGSTFFAGGAVNVRNSGEGIFTNWYLASNSATGLSV